MAPPTQLMGIVNITPDSFSDGGLHHSTEAAVQHIGQLITDGAALIDLGAESTRPDATPLSHEEEWQRLSPILTEALPQFAGRVAFSVDSRHPETAAKALAMGVRWVNDVTGFTNPAMREAVKDSDATLVIMHSLGVPPSAEHTMPLNQDPVKELIYYAYDMMELMEREGIARERLVFDPGIGFGKAASQSMYIITQAERFKELGIPVLFGHSRKSFLRLLGDVPAAERDPATLHLSKTLIQAEVDYLRVHNVAAHATLLREYAETRAAS